MLVLPHKKQFDDLMVNSHRVKIDMQQDQHIASDFQIQKYHKPEEFYGVDIGSHDLDSRPFKSYSR